MKALVKRKSEPGLCMEDVPKPSPGPNDILVRIKKTAICGTDVHIYNWDAWAQKTIPVPMVIGHEFVGVVEEVGAAVTGYKPGDRISGEGHITCGFCRNCRAGRRHLCRNSQGIGVHRPGCFAEYFVLPASNAFVVPEGVPDDVAAIFDPLGNAVHAALSFDLVGEDILITGAGPIGLMASAICRHVGARHIVITDLNEYRLALAQKFGVTRAVHGTKEDLPKVMHEIGLSEGFDVALEMSGSPRALETILQTINYGGRISLLGIVAGDASIEWSQFVFKGLLLKGIYGREMFETWYKMKTMLESGLDISQVITHRMHATDYIEAFDIMRTGLSGKIVLEWH